MPFCTELAFGKGLFKGKGYCNSQVSRLAIHFFNIKNSKRGASHVHIYITTLPLDTRFATMQRTDPTTENANAFLHRACV